MQNATIELHMTKQVITIGREQSLAHAQTLMTQNGIRHLPVLHGGELVGMLSERELRIVEAMDDVDPEKVVVEEALLGEPYGVPVGTALSEVVDYMHDARIGSAAVLEGHRVVGVFTTTDAMRLLAEQLRS